MAEEQEVKRIQELAYCIIQNAGVLWLVKTQVDELTKDVVRAEMNERRKPDDQA